METIPNLIDILNELRRWLELPDDCRECYEVLPKESANEYSMVPIDICKILMPLETLLSDVVFIQNEVHCQSIFKNISII